MPLPQWEPFAADYARGEVIQPHQHDLAQIVFAKRGVMRVHTEVGAWVVPPDRALWMPAGITHWISCRTAVAMRTVYLDRSAAALPASRAVVLSASPLLREVILRLVEGRPANVGPLLAVLADELETTPVAPLHLTESKDPRLRRACAVLAANPGAAIDLTELARAAGASSRTLMRLFPAETGLSFRGWQRQLRVLVALERLAEGQGVTRVALDLGYASPSAFIAAFKAQTGVTPARYFRG